MELYDRVSQQTAKLVTTSYSTSFSMASRLFAPEIRQHIYNIYGLVRIADEVVDGYAGKRARKILDDLESETYQALKSGYSTNPVVQAFAVTAREFGIGRELIKPFFASMRIDLAQQIFTDKQYRDYIYGSAEVVGLMCLKVFCPNPADYKRLSRGAAALGAAFQKINFLRDFASDCNELGRCYFPGVTFESFDTKARDDIVRDIAKDLRSATKSVNQLPATAQPAVKLALRYYTRLFKKLQRATPEEIKTNRLRVSDGTKMALFSRAWVGRILRGRWS